MYMCFKLHDIRPSVFFNDIKGGEKKIIRSFIEREIEEHNEEVKALSRGGGS